MSEFRSLVISSLIHKGCFAAPKDEYLDGFKLKRERVTERLLEMLRDEIAGESVGGIRPFDCSVHYRHLPDSDGQIIILLKSSAFLARPRTVLDFGL